MSAPARCPMCGESLMWKQVDTQKKGFSVGKAALGGNFTRSRRFDRRRTREKESMVCVWKMWFST